MLMGLTSFKEMREGVGEGSGCEEKEDERTRGGKTKYRGREKEREREREGQGKQTKKSSYYHNSLSFHGSPFRLHSSHP